MAESVSRDSGSRPMISAASYLLLDEPARNLDLPSAEVLEKYDGAVLVISHDRCFLDRVAALENGRAAEMKGGYSDYLAAQRKHLT